MGKARVLLVLGLMVCVTGCRKEAPRIPLSDSEKELARQEGDAFLLLIKDYNIEEIEKHLHSTMRPRLRPRLALAVKEARGYSKAELDDISSRVEGIINVRYQLTVDGGDKLLVLHVAKEKNEGYRVTGASISDKR